MTGDPSSVLPGAYPRLILHSLGEGVSIADREGRIIFSNRAADRILGIRATDAPPDQWADHYGVFLPKDRATPFPTDEYPLVRALAGEATDGVVMWIRNPGVPDGALISVTGRPLEDDDGNILGAAVVFRDITALWEAQEELERTNATLQEVQRQKDELAAFVVHDLKSPIAGIMLSAEMLLQDSQPADDGLEALEDIRDSAKRLHRMVLDLLDIRQAEEGRLEPEVEPVSVQTLFAETVRALKARASASGVALSVDHDVADLTVAADPDLLRRVIQNVVTNCLKYSPGGTVVMSARMERESVVVIRVDDDGPGVPPELRDQIFQMWTKSERQEEGRHRDSRGVGLYFCRLAVEAHGGRIWVEDSRLDGAGFCIELPGYQGGA